MSENKKILIADDEPNILLSLEFLMRKNKFEVFVARNGNEAVELLNKHKPDLALLDIMMPDIDGYQICTLIKNAPEFSNCKVIFLSAKSKENEIKKGLELGADAYITKPFSTKQLMERIKEILNQQ